QFCWMVLFHICILVSAGGGVVFFHPPLFSVLAILFGGLLIFFTPFRWWGIPTISAHSKIQVMGAPEMGVVVDGPFRWIRHPNYVAVFIEMIALPLIHAAWLTALAGTAVHALILSRRIRVEESVLFSNSTYMAEMAWKPRFLPRFFDAVKST